MSFGSGGFGGFGQQNQQQQQQPAGFGGFGANNNNTAATTGFGSTGTNAFGSTQNTGGGLFGSTPGSGFGGTGGTFGSTAGGAFGAKPAFGATTTTGAGLFGSSAMTATAGTSGFGGGGGFGTNNASSSTPFGGGSSLFGANNNKPAFGAGATTGTGTSLFGTGGGGFGGGATSSFGATNNPGLGTNVGDPPGTAAVPFTPLVEKDSATSNQQNSYNNILFMEPYRKWSAEELRLADYNQGRRHGNTGGTGAFGVSTGFGTGGFGTNTNNQTSTFGGGAGTSTGTGLFGSTQPATGGFGQAAPATGGFGSAASNLFGAPKPASTGLFGGGTSQPAASTGLFGGTGGFGNTAATTGGFGSNNTAGATGLFGNNANANKPSTGFSFGQTGNQGTGGFGNTGTQNAFGTGSGTTAGAGGLFGGGAQSTGTGLFNNAAQGGTGTGFGGGSAFGNQQQQQQTGSSVFGQGQKPGGLFGQPAATSGTTGLFGNPAQSSTPFGSSATNQQGGGLFGQKPAGTTGGLFGTGTATQTGTTGGGLFGSLGQNTQTQQQPQQQGLFGGSLNQNQQKPSLFGGATQTAGSGGIFGSQNNQQQGGGLFGGMNTQQQQQAPGLGTSMFGATQGNNQQATGSLTTSLNDVSAYGTPSLFQGLGASGVQNPGPLATPLSGSKAKTPRKSSILPMYKLTPGSATKFVTPQKRGYGFSYSTFGTPTSPSSVASTPGGLGQSLLASSVGRGLGKSISSSNLRRSFNVEDSILSPGAFSASSGPRYYGGNGSVKKLVINREVRHDLFSPPPKDKQAQDVNGSRKLTKRVSFDTSVPAIENGVDEDGRASPDTSSSSVQDLGFLRPSSRAPNNVSSTKPPSTDATPEMEQVKGKQLASLPEEGSPATQPKSSKPAERAISIEAGEYWMSPSKDEILKMNRVQRQQVANFTVGRHGVGQVRFKVPVDLTTINLDEIPVHIVELKTRAATVYPIAAKKPVVGKGLNVPAEISLENCWPRGRAQEKSGPRVAKHVERLKQIDDTTFINYEPQTGVWTFSVEHFTTYGLDYEEEETDAEVVTEAQALGEQPALAAHPAGQSSISPNFDPDDTFDFRRKRRHLPGAFDGQEETSDAGEDDATPQQSFLSHRSADFSSLAVVPVTAEDDEDMEHEDALSESQEPAMPDHQQYLPAEHQENSPYLGSIAQVQETPAGIVRARLRAIKESATPAKLQVADGDNWMEMLQKTVSPQKRDRAALRAANESGAAQAPSQGNFGKAPAARSRMVSEGKGFATSIDLMNSLFDKSKPPVQASQTLLPAKGFVKWPYKRQNKNLDEDEANMNTTERAFHDSFKPSWGPDGACIYSTSKPLRSHLIGGLAETSDPTLARVNIFTQRDFSSEDPLDGIVDHRDLVNVDLANGIPTVSTRGVPHVKAFSSFRENAYQQKSATMSPLSRRLGSYELSVWELASVLFDPADPRSDPAEESRVRTENLAKFWANLVQEASSKSSDDAHSQEEKALALLSGHRVVEACRVLMDGKDLKTAALVSLIGSSDSFKKDMREQVEDWHEGDVLSEFTVPLRAIYSLLAGNVTVCPGKKGVGIENRMESEIISQRFNLDWKQAFGLRLWYGISTEEGIAAAVEAFIEDVEQGRVPAPRPWYVDQGIHGPWVDPYIDQREDLLFGLLKVFAGQARLEDVLQPENSQLSPLNFRLCWQLSQALAVTGNAQLRPERLDALTTSFAAEIVYHGDDGDWVAAIWVLLHLTSPASRVRAIQDVLGHHAGSLFTKAAKESNYYERLVDDLKIPASWVWSAAALYWRNKQDQPALEAQCLIKASAFAEAHKILAKELAPKAVVERNYAGLASMLRSFQAHQHLIPDWALGGEVFSNFLELLAHQKRRQTAPAAIVEGLMSSLPAMYEKAGDVGTAEVAAITEMADVVAREATALATTGRMDIAKVSRLPLTEDRRLVYSRDLALAYYRDVVSARG